MADFTELTSQALQNCKEFRDIDRELLRGMEYEYSCSEETKEALEEADPTGRALEKYCTNLKEVEEHDEIWQQKHHEHVKTCIMECCMNIKKARRELGVKGY